MSSRNLKEGPSCRFFSITLIVPSLNVARLLRSAKGLELRVIHQMILTLARDGHISRVPGHARSIRLVVPREELPRLEPVSK